MIKETRGAQIVFAHTFYDANGDVATVSSATLTVVYPNSSSSGDLLARDPGQQKAFEQIAMTEDVSSNSWKATWDSSVADPGVVYWNIISVNPVLSDDGSIVLEGNLANLEAI